MQGILCLGPDKGAKPTYVLLDDWIGPVNFSSLSRNDACEELARRYLSAYGPATPDDMAAWSGLSLTDIRAAWERITRELAEVEIDGQSAWMLTAHLARLDEFSTETVIVRLLADFDTYLLGYRSRDRIVEARYAKRINAGGGMIRPVLLVNGQVVGIWDKAIKRHRLNILVTTFEPLEFGVQFSLNDEVDDMARFLGMEGANLSIL